MKKTLIVGASGFGKEVLACLRDSIMNTNQKIENIACFMDTKEFVQNTKFVHGIPVISDEEFDPEKYKVVVAVGDPKIRRKIVEKLPENTEYTTIIHPSAVISPWVNIGKGTVITAGSVVTTDIKLGEHTHLNLLTTIGHDCVIGDYFTTAPGVKISGICDIGDSVYFGTNSSVRQAIKICDNVTIGMGAVVVKHITEPGIYIGSPAKQLKK